jgi:hypothetical protein
VERHLDHEPEPEEHERGAQETFETVPDERRRGLATSLERVVRTRLENPPTKKKTGMTWNNQVPSHSPEVRPTALVVE